VNITDGCSQQVDVFIKNLFLLKTHKIALQTRNVWRNYI